MKTVFTTVDVAAIVDELKSNIIGLRVNQIYDIDHKTYLIKLQKPDFKIVLLIESASRIHTTEYEWPKNPAPSGFSMKLRKHLRNKRVETIEQLGVDRVVDLTFGSGEAAHHLIAELYDRGNIILTDCNYVILSVLRPRKDGEDTKILVHQPYPLDSVRKARSSPTLEEIRDALAQAKENTPVRKILNSMLDCGGGTVDHELLKGQIPIGAKIGRDVHRSDDVSKIHEAATQAQSRFFNKNSVIAHKGFIIKKLEQRHKTDTEKENVFLYQEFHPQLYLQHKDLAYDEFSSFNSACDEFFSKLEANQVDKKVLQKEKEAMKKLENVRSDHAKRLQELQELQEVDRRKGQLIELNQDLVEGALLVLRSAIANQIDWKHIEELIQEAQGRADPIASAIKALKLQRNTITLWLSNPYDYDENDMLLDSDEEREEGTESEKMRPMAIDIDLDLSALANARKYYNLKRQAAMKHQKTIDASVKAIKSAEKKTQQTLKEVNAIANINKARKVHWFEKYLWFISSENFLVIGGRDSQQNEQIVKRHMKSKDVYVHADLHGASSIIIKNPSGEDVPPRSLHEAGIMALCYSRAWDEKVVTSAWWVWGNQVSKTAPAGEYLTTGAFMVRGKKNFLPPSHLVYGFGFLFRLEDSSIERHFGERKIRVIENEVPTAMSEVLEKLSLSTDKSEELEIELDLEEEAETGEKSTDLETIAEKEDTELEDEKEKDYYDNETKDEPLEEFPDTVIEMSHLKGDEFVLKARMAESSSLDSLKKNFSINENDKKVVYLGDDKPIRIDNKKSKGNKSNVKHQNVAPNKDEEKDPDGKGDKALKRGHKGKLKKMKKYKDQDEEERELVMQLLQSSGSKKASKKEKASQKQNAKGGPNKNKSQMERKTKPEIPKPDKLTPDQPDEEEEDETSQVVDDLSVVNALTALPVAEDELLYAVPVCAPYSSMTNFKYKVKLTPGPGKKGKACKTALNLFLSDRTSFPREKDLLRAVKESDLSRNLPGKVKVSAPNITKVKKK